MGESRVICMIYVGHVYWVGYMLYRPCTTSHSSGLGARWSGWSICRLSIWPVDDISVRRVEPIIPAVPFSFFGYCCTYDRYLVPGMTHKYLMCISISILISIYPHAFYTWYLWYIDMSTWVFFIEGIFWCLHSYLIPGRRCLYSYRYLHTYIDNMDVFAIR